MKSLNAYIEAGKPLTSKDLTIRVLSSIEKYINDLDNEKKELVDRREAGYRAIVLLQELSSNILETLDREEQIILIKTCGQVIRNINRYVRKEQTDLSKELAGIRLIKKLVEPSSST